MRRHRGILAFLVAVSMASASCYGKIASDSANADADAPNPSDSDAYKDRWIEDASLDATLGPDALSKSADVGPESTTETGVDAQADSAADASEPADVDAEPADADSDTGPADAARDSGPLGPRCLGLARNCGANGTDDCCASTVVPGGTFRRGYDGVTQLDPQYTATVSDFRLDTYEITVGRFRAFIAGYPENMPSAGAGKNPNNSADQGWDEVWNYWLPPTQAQLIREIRELRCGLATWTDTPANNENKAMNCIDWHEAFAFCIWDGGRLPTEAEWNYAAAGGSEQRVYPWSTPPSSTTIDSTYAVYNGAPGVAAVGSKAPKGSGKWGHADLAGNVAEWVLDWWATPYSVNPCIDCADLTQTINYRTYRNGSYYDPASRLRSSDRDAYYDPQPGLGARCARAP